ncbi:MAG: hypothetical protein DVB22_000057 [Verrucomicrobia bacterium]|nr:MAG: hypothetical protein DVB22_000057 [Verrucomicrobiota bacterium]
MSGPKVINIKAVRRQQRRASLADLRRLELALIECERWHAQPQSSSLLERLHAMREAEEWEPLSAEMVRLAGFYEGEVHRLRQQHAMEQAASLRRAHRLRQGIAQMISQLEGHPVGSERDYLLGQLAAGDVSAQETALNEGLRFIGQKDPYEDTSRLRELAAGLLDHGTSCTPALPQVPTDPQQLRLERCWNLLGELSALAPSTELQTLTENALYIAIAPVDQQPLLLDSLALELSSQLQLRRTSIALRHEMEILLVELGAVRAPEAAAWKARLATEFTQLLPLDSTPTLLADTRAWIEQTIAEESRADQRAAVLRALAASGYEVREGMATAWVEQGRLVLRKPNESTYGIELSAPPQGNAVQTRVVALGNSPRNPQRDLEVEETWCGEFAKARESLHDDGFHASLVQSNPAGSIPLKIVSIPPSNHYGRQASKLREAPQRNPEK